MPSPTALSSGSDPCIVLLHDQPLYRYADGRTVVFGSRQKALDFIAAHGGETARHARVVSVGFRRRALVRVAVAIPVTPPLCPMGGTPPLDDTVFAPP